jgi:hypothetical protein
MGGGYGLVLGEGLCEQRLAFPRPDPHGRDAGAAAWQAIFLQGGAATAGCEKRLTLN